MRKRLLQPSYRLAGILLGIVLVGLLGCRPTGLEPQTPEDETQNKLHENPHYIILELQEGRLPLARFNDSPKVKEVDLVGDVQRVEMYSATGISFGLNEASPQQKFIVKTSVDDPERVYVFRVSYLNGKKVPMDYQFFDNGQDLIHQHFFTTYQDTPNGSRLVRDYDKIALDFRYADVHPVTGLELSDVNNVLGFRGIMRFLKSNASDIRLELLHAVSSKFDSKTHKPSPFYAPTNAQRSTDKWDIRIKLPIEIQ